MNKNDIERLRALVSKSPFSKPTHGNPTIGVKNFFRSLKLYRDEFENDTKSSNSQLLNAMTPSFQRENTKWSQEMKISFLENVLSGFRADLLLYFVSQEDAGYCYILDGLQRITAFQEFTDGQFPVFESFYYEDLFAIKGIRINQADVTLKIYEFPSHRAACEHYIAMNKNITHSPEDLETAYAFLNAGS